MEFNSIRKGVKRDSISLCQVVASGLDGWRKSLPVLLRNTKSLKKETISKGDTDKRKEREIGMIVMKC